MNKRRPTVVRATKAMVAARNFIMEHDIKNPSVPIKKMIKKFARLFFFDNSNPDFAEEEGFIKLIKSEYRVYINRDLSVGRDNFTYGHELGHIYLKHHEEFNIDTLTDRELWRLDREANIFAVNCLMPAHWIENHAQTPITVQEIGRLKTLFDVSWEAIINRLDELKIHSKKTTEKLFNDWHNLKTIGEHRHATYVKEVGEVYFTGINYCTSIKSREVIKLSGDFKIPEFDENMRFTECPMCGNTDFSDEANFCKKCGQYLFNLCTNLQNDPREQSDWCGKPNTPDAQYCEYCGAITMVGQLLKNDAAATNEEEYNGPSFSEDDIPF